MHWTGKSFPNVLSSTTCRWTRSTPSVQKIRIPYPNSMYVLLLKTVGHQLTLAPNPLTDRPSPQRHSLVLALPFCTVSFCELQSDAFVRRYPDMRIATMRFHWVVPTEWVNRETLHERGGSWKDLWGWVSLEATAKAVVLGLTAPESKFPKGHESFFICSRTTCQQRNSMELLRTKFPEIRDIRKRFVGNEAMIDCSRAERMLGWKEDGFPMKV